MNARRAYLFLAVIAASGCATSFENGDGVEGTERLCEPMSSAVVYPPVTYIQDFEGGTLVVLLGTDGASSGEAAFGMRSREPELGLTFASRLIHDEGRGVESDIRFTWYTDGDTRYVDVSGWFVVDGVELRVAATRVRKGWC